MNRIVKIGNMYYSDYSVFTDGKRKRIRRALSPYKEVAEDMVADLLKAKRAEKSGGTILDPSWLYFKERFKEYSKGKNPDTHRRDMLAFQYLEAFCAPRRLADITLFRLEQFKAWLKQHGKHDLNINRMLSAIKAAMRMAENWKMRPPENWRIVKAIKTPKGRLLFWSPKEVDQLMAECLGPWKTIAYLAVYAGMRRGEIRALRWENVDFERNRLHIVGDAQWSPKDYERRWIPMKDKLAEYMKKLPKGDEYVLGEDRYAIQTMTDYMRRVIKQAGLKGSLHTGRHTYGSQLAMAGIPLAVIKQRMGHDSIETTEIYTHLCPETMGEQYAA